MKALNWQIAQHPMNWLTITMMLVIASIGGHLLLSLLGHEPKSDSQYTTKQTA